MNNRKQDIEYSYDHPALDSCGSTKRKKQSGHSRHLDGASPLWDSRAKSLRDPSWTLRLREIPCNRKHPLYL